MVYVYLTFSSMAFVRILTMGAEPQLGLAFTGGGGMWDRALDGWYNSFLGGGAWASKARPPLLA